MSQVVTRPAALLNDKGGKGERAWDRGCSKIDGCSMMVVKQTPWFYYNRLSIQNLSETAQNPARFFENNILAHSIKAVPAYMRKKDRKHCLLTKISKRRHVEGRGKTIR